MTPIRFARTPLLAALLALPVEAALFERTLDAQSTLTTGTAREVGMSAAVLDGAVGLYREAVEAGELVGAVVLVARNGKVVVHEAIGSRNWQAGQSMERNTMFRMASNTKPVIATAIAMLVERGQLSYDDPVRKYIPSFDNYKAGFMTVGQLLSHTSGFRINTLFLQPYAARSARNPNGPTLQSEVARFGEVGAAFPPGGAYSYSNPGYNTLGALIEIVSGKPLDVFLRDEIYQPLGMADTYHMEVDEKLDGKLNRMGAVYYERTDGRWVSGWQPGEPPQVPFVRASGGLISTAWDYAVFLQAMLNGGSYGGAKLVEPRTVELMTRRHTPQNGPAYGYGWQLENGTYGHGGSDGTFAWVDPERGIVAMVLTQTPRGANPIGKFRQLVNIAVEDQPRR